MTDKTFQHASLGPINYVAPDPNYFDAYDYVDSTTIGKKTLRKRIRTSGRVVSQNGLTANDRSLIGQFTIPGTQAKMALRTGDVSVVLIHFSCWFHFNVESLHRDPIMDEWGYAERKVVGGTSLSNHASGSAVDLNATRHPLAATNTFSQGQQARIRLKLIELAGVVRAGMFYAGRKDDMHFEIHNLGYLPSIANRIRDGEFGYYYGNPGPPDDDKPFTPLKTGEVNVAALPILVRDDNQQDWNQAVRNLQGLLRAAAREVDIDGYFGAGTEAALKSYQSDAKIGVDGECGPITWSTLLGVPRP